MLKFLNKIFQIFIDFLVFIITILILFSLYKLIVVKIYHKPYANTLGYSIFEIATGSMEPTLKVKDLIIVKITKNIKENDIISIKRFGKYKYVGKINETKKNNYVIKFLKYI